MNNPTNVQKRGRVKEKAQIRVCGWEVMARGKEVEAKIRGAAKRNAKVVLLRKQCFRSQGQGYREF